MVEFKAYRARDSRTRIALRGQWGRSTEEWGEDVSCPVTKGKGVQRMNGLARLQATSQSDVGVWISKSISMLVHVMFQNIPEAQSKFVQHEYSRM